MNIRPTHEVALEDGWTQEARRLSTDALRIHIADLDNAIDSTPGWAANSNADHYRRLERIVYQAELDRRQS